MPVLVRPCAMRSSTVRSRSDRVASGSLASRAATRPATTCGSRADLPAATRSAAARNSSTCRTRSFNRYPKPPSLTRLTEWFVSMCWDNTSTPQPGGCRHRGTGEVEEVVAFGVIRLVRRPGTAGHRPAGGQRRRGAPPCVSAPPNCRSSTALRTHPCTPRFGSGVAAWPDPADTPRRCISLLD